MSTIHEDRKFDFQAFDANKKYEIKPTDTETTLSGKMDKLHPISVHEFYDFKIQHLDET